MIGTAEILAAAPGPPSVTPLVIIAIYLALLLGLAMFSAKLFRGTSTDYFVASRSIGPFMLLMSVFGTTMTAFALVGSTGKAFERGIGVYGLMASSSGLIHAACFFLIGIKLWSFGKKYGYVTQIQFFRDRYASDKFGYLLFPILVLLVIPYLLIGILGAGKTIAGVTRGMFPDFFSATGGAVPSWLTGIVICVVVLLYIFSGGSRATAWANTFQTIVFMCMGMLAFYLISQKLGGLKAAIEAANDAHLVRTPSNLQIGEGDGAFNRHVGVPQLMFLSYMFIPLSVGMFPHLFQHWLTARSARSFRLTLIAHPLCIMIVWVPCVLIGVWGTAVFAGGIAGMPPPLQDLMRGLPNQNTGAVLSLMVKGLIQDPVIVGLVTAGILAAIMSSLDSQFLCLGTMFTNDIVLHGKPKDRYTDKQIVWIARSFVIGIVILTYVLSLLAPAGIFNLAVWSFSGFASLTPVVFAAIYWRRSTKAGAYAAVIAATVCWGILFVRSGFGVTEGTIAGIMPVAFCFLAGAAAMVVVSLATSPPSEETVEKFFPKFSK
ncbi:MAG: sodium:solute symporter family protein [Verrucomicrobiales bacterium]